MPERMAIICTLTLLFLLTFWKGLRRMKSVMAIPHVPAGWLQEFLSLTVISSVHVITVTQMWQSMAAVTAYFM